MTIRYLKLITTCELYIYKCGLVVATRIDEKYDDYNIKQIIPFNDDLHIMLFD